MSKLQNGHQILEAEHSDDEIDESMAINDEESKAEAQQNSAQRRNGSTRYQNDSQFNRGGT